MAQAERHIEARQRETLDQPGDVSEFGGFGAQELAPRRQIEEKVAHFHQGALRLRRGGRRLHLATVDPQLGAARRADDPRGDAQAGDRTDRRQRLTAETHRADRREVEGGRYLAGRVPLHRERQLILRDAVAIVEHAHQRHATRFAVDLDAARAGVEAVLH